MDPDTSYPPRLFEHELREATLIGQLVSCPAVELSTAPVQGLAMALVEGNNVSVSVAGEICDVKCLLSELLRIQIAGWRCDLTVSAVALDLGGDSSLVDLIDASPETDDEAGTLAFVNEELGHVLEVWVRTEAQAIRILESAFAVTPNLSQKDQVAVFTLRKHRNGNPDSAITSRLVIRFPVLDMIRTLKSELEARRSEKDAQLNQSIQMKGPSEVKSAALGLVGNKVAQLEAALALEKAAHQETINYFTSELEQRAELINSLEGQVRDAAKSNTEAVDHSVNTSALLAEKIGIISTLMAEAEELKAARQKSDAALAAEILAHQESIQRYTSKLADKSYEMESMKTELTNLKSTAALSPNTSKDVSLNQISIHSERNSKGVAGVLGQSLPSPPPEAPTLARLSTPEMRSMSPAGPPTSPAPSNPILWMLLLHFPKESNPS
ncbi:hypothetical protein BCR33DRAFT_345162 [Rhizoclosmatium globosum]|uniref:Uncharacterized protein n=1 Tax=Rhizoclosmatium globosum TaxID=329046 RepID=A0A1Y2C2Y7_9FUNG|nr:hypothetical protein BCR33DRAFT_345162 [Rhizoclosmatium globosum]|eukprot:ORY41371.1 hypothetical protein BCR33DRAFT_345162 [Rhizoclosmatium globosum]